jgi:hypothetical protein
MSKKDACPEPGTSSFAIAATRSIRPVCCTTALRRNSAFTRPRTRVRRAASAALVKDEHALLRRERSGCANFIPGSNRREPIGLRTEFPRMFISDEHPELTPDLHG